MVLHQNTAIRSLSRLRRQLLSYIPAKQNSCFHGDSLMRNYALGRRRGVRISHPGLKPGLLSLPRSSSSSTTASLGRVGVYSCRIRGPGVHRTPPRRPSHLPDGSSHRRTCSLSDFRMNNYALGRRRGVRISQPGLKARAAVAPALLLFLHDRFAGSCRSLFLPRSVLRKPTGLFQGAPNALKGEGIIAE